MPTDAYNATTQIHDDTEESQRRKRLLYTGAPARRGFGGLARDILGGGDYADLLGAAGGDLAKALNAALTQAAGVPKPGLDLANLGPLTTYHFWSDLLPSF